MRKPKLLVSLPLIFALALSACAGTPAEAPEGDAAPAEESAITPAAGLPDEPYQAVEYNLYPAPDGGYVGDVMPFVTEDGTLEL